MLDPGAVRRFAHDSLAAIADPDAAAGMASYMRSTMPCHGVTRPKTKPILHELCERWPPTNAAEYRTLVEELWALPHREEKYLAIGVARAHDRFVTGGSIPMYRRMIVSGAWWDFVDEIAIRLVGRALDKDPEHITPTIRRWIDHPDPWVRRTAIICQVARKESTDSGLLFEACARRSHETDFFIRKAIGWALRSYAYTNPDAVRRFVAAHGEELSGLSRREATKHL